MPTRSDIRELAISFNDGSLLTLKKLMTTNTGDYESFGNYAQANSVVFYLLNRGNRGQVKGAIALYLISLESIIREEDKKFEEAVETQWQAERAARESDEGKTEEELEAEEDERFRQRRQRRNEHSSQLEGKYSAIRERALKVAFGHLTDDDWKSLDKRWRKFAKP